MMGMYVLIACIALLFMLVFLIRIVNNMQNGNLSEEERNEAVRNNRIGMIISALVAAVFAFSAFR